MSEVSVAKPLILISQRVDYIESRSETRDSLDQALSRWVIAGDAIPVNLSNMLPQETLIELLTQLKPAGIILSGGNNIGDFSDRDQTEIHLLDWAKLNDIPVLGICRGMQLIGFWSGAGLSAVDGHTAKKHNVKGILNALVNSYHDYSLDSVPNGFSPLAYSEEGNLEAIASNLKWRCEGWMWHPERDIPFDTKWLARFRSLMKLD